MKNRIQVPDTELSIFPLGLGTVDAGVRWGADDSAEVDRIFDTYMDQGGNLIDCAHVYADWIKVNGVTELARAERITGDWLHRSGKRSQVVLITKGGHPVFTDPGMDLHINRVRKSDMEKDIDESLAKLRTDYIDIYFYHRDDLTVPVEQMIETMQDFVRSGKIRYYGCSNWSSNRIREADDYCKKMAYRGFIANQSLLNLGSKYMNPFPDDTLGVCDDDMFSYHMETPRNIMMPFMGVCSGFFHVYDAQGEAAVKNSPYFTLGNVRVAQRVRELRRDYGCTVTQAVLGFFYQQSFNCVPLYSPAAPEHVVDACNTLTIPFRKEDYEI